MIFKCNKCGGDRASIREQEISTKEHYNLDDFPINSRVWDKDWRLYCFYGVFQGTKTEFHLMCSNCHKEYGPASTYDHLIKNLYSAGVLK